MMAVRSFEDKESLREQLKNARQNLADQEVAVLSKSITTKILRTLDLSSTHSIHTYLPIRSLKEVDTRPFLEYVWGKYPKIRTATWNRKGKNYTAAWVDKLGNSSPVPDNFQYDLIVVPVLGFDKNNHRLGWGGGYYDRFLAAQPQALKIGLAYKGSFIDELPTEPHDIALDKVITEI